MANNFRPINLGDLMLQGEQIKSMRHARDSNNLDNLIKQAKLAELQNPSIDTASYSKSPFFVRHGDQIKGFQLSDQGGAREIELPEGAIPAIRGKWTDMGGGYQLLDPYGRDPSTLLGAMGGQTVDIPSTSDLPKGDLSIAAGFIEKTLPPSKQPKNIEAAEQAKQDVKLETEPRIQEKITEAKGGAERKQEFIATGIAAADALPTINRGLELLESGVKTGGFNNLKLWLTDTLGITGADEGELSAKLGKAVLKQLRSTFGAAFTEREGARLERIEAGFGKSAAVNMRLLQELKAMSERELRRGMAAAKSSNDEFSFAEMQRAIDAGKQMSDAEYQKRKKELLGE